MTIEGVSGDGELVRNAVALERRLTTNEQQMAAGLLRLEELLEAAMLRLGERVDAGYRSTHARLDLLNGQTAENTQYRIDHKQAHAVSDGVVVATRQMRKRDWAVLAGSGSLMAAVIGAAATVVNMMAG